MADLHEVAQMLGVAAAMNKFAMILALILVASTAQAQSPAEQECNETWSKECLAIPDSAKNPVAYVLGLLGTALILVELAQFLASPVECIF